MSIFSGKFHWNMKSPSHSIHSIKLVKKNKRKKLTSEWSICYKKKISLGTTIINTLLTVNWPSWEEKYHLMSHAISSFNDATLVMRQLAQHLDPAQKQTYSSVPGCIYLCVNFCGQLSSKICILESWFLLLRSLKRIWESVNLPGLERWSWNINNKWDIWS